MTTPRAVRRGQFVVCIRSDDDDIDIVAGKVYRVVSPARHDRASDIRVVDESGEDYLYPRAWFVPVELSPKARKALTGKR